MTAMTRSATTGTGNETTGGFDTYLLWFVNTLILFWLIVTSGAIFPLLTLGSGEELDEAARSRLRLLLLPSITLAPLLLLLRFRAIAVLLLRNTALLALVLWAAISIIWSVAPDLTGRRAFGLTVNTIIACYLVIDRDFDRLLRLFFWCFLILMIVNAVFIVALPHLATMPDARGLRGAFLHKNSLGETAAVALIIFFAALRSGSVKRWVGTVAMVLAFGLLVTAGAASSIVAGAVVLGIQAYFITDMLPPRTRLVIFTFGFAALIALIGLMAANLDVILDLLGRDATLTGRTDIWAYVLHVSAERPWLGYGYAAFFEAEHVARYVMDSFQWSIPTAHNGYLEMRLGLGWIGLALLLYFFLNMAFRLALNWRRLPPGLGMLALPILAFYATQNITETTVLASNGLGWVVMVLAALLLTPGLRTGR